MYHGFWALVAYVTSGYAKKIWGAVGRLDAAGCKDLDNVCGARPILPTGTMSEYIYMIE